jgi:diadenosine tetraphosphate (Ap4A) HIT family hydrolase
MADAQAPSVFTRIIDGEIPGRFVWRDPQVVAFLTIAPIRPGHVLVVPRRQVDKWTDVEPATWARVCEVTLHLGRAIDSSFECARVGVIVAGLEVPHCHVHLVPIRTESDLDFSRADQSADATELDAAAETIRTALRAAGHSEVADA